MVQYEPVLPEERAYYEQLVKAANPSGGEAFATKDLAAFLQSSKLGVADLRTIWAIGSDGASKIDRSHAITMMRCVALVQAGVQLSPQNAARAEPGPLPMPKFETPGVPAPPTNLVVPESATNGQHPPQQQQQQQQQPAAAAAAAPADQHGAPRPSTPASVSGASAFETASVSGSVSGGSWAMSANKRAQYEDLFKKQKLNEGKLESKEAMEFFMKSHMPWEQLSEILRLADLDQDLKLTVDEFCIAMHMVLCVSRKGYTLPSEVPRELLPNQPRSAPPTAADAVAASRQMQQPQQPPPPQHGQPPFSHQRQGSMSQMSETGSLPDAAPMGPGSFSSSHNNNNSFRDNMPGPSGPVPAREAPAGPTEMDVQRATETNDALSGATATMAAASNQLDAEKQRLAEEMVRLGAERDRLVDELKTASEEVASRQGEMASLRTDLELLRETVTQLRVSVEQQKAQVQAVSLSALEKLAEKGALEREAASLKTQIAELQEQANSFQAAISSSTSEAAAPAPAPAQAAAAAAASPPSRAPPSRAPPAPAGAAANASEPPVPDSVGESVPAALAPDAASAEEGAPEDGATASTDAAPEAQPPAAAAAPPQRRAPTREAPVLSPPANGSTAATAGSEAAQAPDSVPAPATEGSTASGWNSVPMSKPSETVDSSAFDEAFGGDMDPFEEASSTHAGSEAAPASDAATAGAGPSAATSNAEPSTDLNAVFSDAGFEDTFDFDKK